MPNYTALKTSVDGFEVVRLTDASHNTEVAMIPSIGNIANEMKVNGHNVLWWPHRSLQEFKAKPSFAGIPFLAPWANRLDQDAFYANGQKYILNPALGNFRRDPNGSPIHGLLSYTGYWQVASLTADEREAAVVSRLEFWKHPDLMAQFPFAHTLEMKYRLSGGILEVQLTIENHSEAPMPLSIGFHPYYQLTDATRDQWRVHLAAADHYELSDKLIPTGAKKAVEFPDPVSLSAHQLDDVFGGVSHGDEFWVEGAQQRLSIRYGEKYRVAVVYAPPGKDFICFEPMTGITDAFNLAHAGLYSDLQSVPAGGEWEESFWIRPSGF
ncbi:MAG TPA: aldose 1-epimerase [Bryobacteraceae bacterium]|nr:aldose 1-epimerase [Bryobacteraceae bacterium]